MRTTRELKVQAALRTGLLMASLLGILVGAGFLIGGPEVAALFLAFGLLFDFIAFFFSDKIALRMSRAEPLDNPQIQMIVEELSLRAGIPNPRIYRIPQSQPNAFATGRSPRHSAVALTDGLMAELPEDELRGVIAHELAHIANRDILVQSVAAAIGGAISYLGYMIFWVGSDNNSPLGLIGALLLVILAPLSASLIQMAISRQREFAADAGGAQITGNPESLASALMRIEQLASAKPMRGHVPESTEPLYIIKPFRARGMARLFSTHPPTAERARRLREMRPSL